MATNRRPMRIRRIHALFCLLALLVSTGCDSSQTAIEARWRFIGLQALSQQTNAPAAAAAVRLPEFARLRGPLADRIAAALWESTAGNTNLPAAQRVAIQPLITDVLDHLSLGQIVRTTAGRREWVIVVPGDAARAHAWETAWPAFFKAARGTTDGAGSATVLFQTGWIIAVSDANATPPQSVMTALAQIPVEPQAVLHLETSLAHQPRIQLTAAARQGAIRAEAHWVQDQKFPDPLPAWERPSIIRDPLIHFTAARGIAAWAAQFDWLKTVAGTDVPDQIFVWGKPAATTNSPALQTYVAARVAQPETWIDRSFQQVQPLYPAEPAAPIWSGQLMLETNHHSALIAGFPPVRLAPIHEGNRSYVLLGMMPQGPSKLPFPPELAAQVERPGILYYQWEIVAEAFSNFNAAVQAGDILRRRLPSTQRPGIAWAIAASAAMGETVTEAQVSGPREFTVKRKSPAGLSAAEMIYFARWIDGPALSRPQAAAKPSR